MPRPDENSEQVALQRHSEEQNSESNEGGGAEEGKEDDETDDDLQGEKKGVSGSIRSDERSYGGQTNLNRLDPDLMSEESSPVKKGGVRGDVGDELA